MPGIADLETSDKAANPALSIRVQQRRRRRARHQRAAGRRDVAPADRRRYRQLLARPGRPELRSQRAACAQAPRARLGPRQPLPVDQPHRTQRRAADGAAAPGRRHRRVDEPADHQARRSLQRRVALYANAQGRPSGDVGSDVDKIVKSTDAAAGLPLLDRRPAAGHGRLVQRGAGRAGPCGDLHLPDPGVAVRELHAAGRDHGVAAVLADRRVPRAAAHRHHAQHLLDDRLHHADGARHQERDPAGRLRQSRAPRRREPVRRADAGGAGAAAADPDDHRRR